MVLEIQIEVMACDKHTHVTGLNRLMEWDSNPPFLYLETNQIKKMALTMCAIIYNKYTYIDHQSLIVFAL